MRKPLRVLVVEDSEDDTFFLMRELKKNGFDPEFERVESARQMTDALEKKRWDIIISDHTVPGFPAVWRRWRSSRRSRSIFHSSSCQEPSGSEVAVNVMKAGASDYVMKGQAHAPVSFRSNSANCGKRREPRCAARRGRGFETKPAGIGGFF